MYSRTVSCTCLFSPALNLKPSASGLVEQQPGLELRDKARIGTGPARCGARANRSSLRPRGKALQRGQRVPSNLISQASVFQFFIRCEEKEILILGQGSSTVRDQSLVLSA
ncbi:hypothetical protein SDJN03_15774, partial [Cucurbita argyrosperma subsp. sororia]